MTCQQDNNKEKAVQYGGNLRLFDQRRREDGMRKNIGDASGTKVYQRHDLGHENQKRRRNYERDAVV